MAAVFQDPIPDFHFDRAAVGELTDKDPWKRREDFTKAVEPDAMADTAAAYQRAAAEAHTVKDLATTASRIAEEAGHHDHAPLADAAERIDMTTRDIDEPGIEKVIGAVQKTMNAALDTDEAVEKLIHDGGLEYRLSRHAADAATEWAGWQAARDIQLPGAGHISDNIPTISISYNGRSVPIPPTWAGDTYSYPLTQTLADDVRNRHLDQAVETTEDYDAKVADEITAYLHRLAGYARELDDAGYDLWDGPLDLFTSPEAATLTAEALTAELAKDHPDIERLTEYTSLIRMLRDDIVHPVSHFDREGAGGNEDPFKRPMTREEREYLLAFFGALTPETLSGVGRDLFERDAGIGDRFLPTGVPSLSLDERPISPAPDAASLEGVTTDLANGILMLTDHWRGGGVQTYGEWPDEYITSEVPDSIGSLLAYETDDKRMNSRADPDDVLHFGTLLDTATMPASADMRHHALVAARELRGHQVDDEGSYFGKHYADWDVDYDSDGFGGWDTSKGKWVHDSGYEGEVPEWNGSHWENVEPSWPGANDYENVWNGPEWSSREGVFGWNNVLERWR
ncbi:hypothetical protein [Streptomyces sp. NPDC049881]|uniref:hypothetical protein n=1 Tax=Streptomyces sp. NPDC049881 TaxID=3155778 RepID=UPI003449EFE7